MASLKFCAAVALIAVCLSSLEISASADEAAQNRKLLQSSAGCAADYTTMDYSAVTSACQSPYPADACCKAYNEFCAPHKSELNDLSKMCAMYFLSYLNMAGSYSNGVFLGRCNAGNNVCT